MTYGGKNELGPPTRGMAPRGALEVVALRDQKTGEEIAITEERRYVIGQSASCDVVVSDPCVSRLHCVIERRDGSVYVRDKGSRNGTFINDRRIECGELTPGIELAIGETRYLVLGPRGGGQRTAFARLIGQDRALRQAMELARRAALTDVSVLVLGETGTGKELVAQAIHETSSRSRQAFVPVNCGAIPRELIGSELYGHERGAFTGAVVERDGVFGQADRGTLFLDELGELPLEQQPHLLRVLETRRVRRVGGAHERPVDVRVVAATNRMSGLGT
jgi:transcriptional regulator of acetoin/glycerol metabolism